MPFFSQFPMTVAPNIRHIAARVVVTSLLAIASLVSCGTDPDNDEMVTVPVPEDGADDSVNELDSETDTSEGDTNVEVVEDSVDDAETTNDGSDDTGDVEVDSADVTETDVVDAGGEVCTTVCDCPDQVGDYCRRPPGVCFPVTIPQDRQYCCTSDTCPTGEICETPDGSNGVCP